MGQIVAISSLFAAAVSAIVVTIRCMAWEPRSRGLFRFHDGKRIRQVDPISVLMALESHPKFRLDLDPKRALEDGDQEAMALLADAVRSAFGVREFSSPRRAGLTVYECVELLAVFSFYVDSQKKSTNTSPTCPPSTESTSIESTAATTPSMSASG